jgi:hypothetical protein
MEGNTEIIEKKVVIMNRKPPGDRWFILPDTMNVYESLTEALEEYFQRSGETEYFISAKEGTVSVIYKEEIKVEKPIQKYSLYGEY